MRARKVDDNQSAIVEAFRKSGCAVVITSSVGDGFPDLLIWCRGHTVLIEIKDGGKSPSARKLTPAQIKFHANWPGKIAVVESVDDAIKLIKRYN